MIEYVWRYAQDMFETVDFLHRAEEVRNVFKFHISQFLFFSSDGYVYRFVYLLQRLKKKKLWFFLFSNQFNSKKF